MTDKPRPKKAAPRNSCKLRATMIRKCGTFGRFNATLLVNIMLYCAEA